MLNGYQFEEKLKSEVPHWARIPALLTVLGGPASRELLLCKAGHSPCRLISPGSFWAPGLEEQEEKTLPRTWPVQLLMQKK